MFKLLFLLIVPIFSQIIATNNTHSDDKSHDKSSKFNYWELSTIILGSLLLLVISVIIFIYFYKKYKNKERYHPIFVN